MGTIAGDDTILLVLRQGFTPAQALEVLEKVIPDINSHLIV